MSATHPALLKSSFASFGYDADGFIMSLVDVVGVANDESAVAPGEACIVGSSPAGLFASLPTGMVAFHRSNPDVWDFMTPAEVRTVFDRVDSTIKVWDPQTGVMAWRTINTAASSIPSGAQGQVLFNKDGGTGYEADNLVKEAVIVETADELATQLTLSGTVLVDVVHSIVYEYDPIMLLWVVSTGDIDSIFGIGRFVWSAYRSRLYYNKGHGQFQRMTGAPVIPV